ncbi:NADH-quinone oxidoreductase subunit NuoF [Halothermothrix orenii]|uniref:NADH dehydrogenase I subunit F n=1 Tax=Halothermothrix orenii (strain H 168 / OCM 544 / DSM 9562) TaxID=373903 RepID=B8D0X3_HALOH|nr:NADH-quinone oxidoreductase subunit NuoF [Halothermothrix orenii]ACL68942.1 NADH dehydrogenase I subunit F [Halothermothrix orenii H 168]
MIKSKTDLEEAIKKAKDKLQEEGLRILVCAGTGCVAGGSLEIFDELKKKVENLSLPVKVGLLEEKESNVTVKTSGCHGFCEKGPLVKIEPLGILFTKVSQDDVDEIINDTIKAGKLVDKLIYKSPDGEAYSNEKEIPFYANQNRIALSNCGNIDPEDLDDYLAHGGYKALSKALLEMSPEEVCKEVTESGLRGRGGGGFPTGKKWEFAYREKADQKYVIVNGDEGDPGAFMDRSIMEGDPHRVIEGITIAGYATGATKGYIYVRAEYPLAVKRLRKAINDAYDQGLLGEDILGSGFDFDLMIKEGAGAFVCGEETALMASIEGKRGMPNPKPPFPAQSGLWGKPTTINNVETLANVPQIILKGADWFTSLGTENSPGTKTFAITGDVANTGLIEVPMGMTLRELVYDIGGGIKNNNKFKAVQIGGPSGGCLTEEHLDMPMDFDSLQEVGAMIGSGGLVVMDENTCMVEVARFFMEFTQNESCGKCVLCREGTKQMLKILERIVEGKGTMEDLDLLEELALAVKDGSLCGLGKTAPNPVLTTLKYFRDEYEAHVKDKKCPAGVCEALKSYKINPDLCKGCSLCARKCPVDAISGKVKEPFVIDQDKCIKCGACYEACKFNAVEVG